MFLSDQWFVQDQDIRKKNSNTTARNAKRNFARLASQWTTQVTHWKWSTITSVIIPEFKVDKIKPFKALVCYYDQNFASPFLSASLLRSVLIYVLPNTYPNVLQFTWLYLGISADHSFGVWGIKFTPISPAPEAKVKTKIPLFTIKTDKSV